MAQAQKARAALLALFPDNVTGQISAQDFRDFLVTIMNEEFAFEGDFWAQPAAAQLTAEGIRGWIIYSQPADSDFSFGEIGYLTVSNTWKRANVSDSTENCLLALAGSEISAGNSGIFLRRGLVFKSAYSGAFSGFAGLPIYLESGSPGSIAGPNSTQPTAVKVIGVIEDDDKAVFRFEPDWSVVGA